MLQPGEIAPDFTLLNEQGTPVTLSAFRGRQAVVLIFYPGDGTPLCTRQLCAVRNVYGDFRAAGVVALGINPFSRWGKERFAHRHRFPFSLLVDSGQRVGHLYRTVVGIGPLAFTLRSVYGVDREGYIVFAERGNPGPTRVLDAVRAASPQAAATGPDGACPSIQD